MHDMPGAVVPANAAIRSLPPVDEQSAGTTGLGDLAVEQPGVIGQRVAAELGMGQLDDRVLLLTAHQHGKIGVGRILLEIALALVPFVDQGLRRHVGRHALGTVGEHDCSGRDALQGEGLAVVTDRCCRLHQQPVGRWHGEGGIGSSTRCRRCRRLCERRYAACDEEDGRTKRPCHHCAGLQPLLVKLDCRPRMVGKEWA
jgi:hypothetical protein